MVGEPSDILLLVTSKSLLGANRHRDGVMSVGRDSMLSFALSRVIEWLYGSGVLLKTELWYDGMGAGRYDSGILLEAELWDRVHGAVREDGTLASVSLAVGVQAWKCAASTTRWKADL